MKHVLIIDADHAARNAVVSSLRSSGYDVTIAGDAGEGIRLYSADSYHAVVIEIDLPDMDGYDLLSRLIQAPSHPPVIVYTSQEGVQCAVQAMRAGAWDYVEKTHGADAVLSAVRKACEGAPSGDLRVSDPKGQKKKYSFEGLIGDSAPMHRVYEMIEKISDTDSTVLVTGESGTGKELIARTIHAQSSRRENPFVPLNCAAIPKDLLESELFGHEKGSFTGALFTRIGRFELAHKGTLFLDEIGELDPSLQVKLLRVIQEREFERVGGVKTIKVEVRIIAATNTDLDKATKEGRFREDLFYRLNVLPLHIPPLRKKTEDIPALVDHFAKLFCRKRKRETFSFSHEAMEALMAYRWPGNVRELENLIERLSILTTSRTVTLSDLPEQFHKDGISSQDDLYSRQGTFVFPQLFLLPEHGIDLHDLLETIERNLILQALEKTNGVRSRAAVILGLNRTTLIEKMKKMGLGMRRGGTAKESPL